MHFLKLLLTLSYGLPQNRAKLQKSMKHYTLKKEYRDRILESHALTGIIADMLGVSPRSVERYCAGREGKSHPILTSANVLEAIRQHLNLPEDEPMLHIEETVNTTTDL